MKNHITILLLFVSSFAFSQTKKDILIQKWKLDKVEEFGEEYSPMENQKNDWLSFSDDGKFNGIIENNHVEGTWSVTEKKITVSVDKKLSQTKINWTKVKALEKGRFKLEYQNGDLITAILLFIPAK